MSADNKTTQPPPPLTLYYLGKPVRLLLHQQHGYLAAADIRTVIGPRLGKHIQQQLHPQSHWLPRRGHEQKLQCWPLPALQHTLSRSRQPAAQRLLRWLNRQVLPALAQGKLATPRLEQALALSVEAGQHISHAILRAVLEQAQGWQHSHWLLTLHYTPHHRSRHAHGRLLALDCQVQPLQALARQIARPNGLSANNVDLLRLAAACHQQLARRMEKRAWQVQAAEQGVSAPSD
ncbi:hypothetical protein [Aquitalea sp. ASV15]|uniref:hypothetical protein n=1 Tax=Aquitalea sp. ASV15 TaxID=2795104 RepID=UPI0018EDAA19|nr:hypothetical protein [Aquitalea sp. ASV15]